MKKSKFTEQQIAFALRQAETGTKVKEIIRQLGITEQTFYRWKRKFGGLGPSELRKLRLLEEETRRLKKLVADLSLDKAGIGASANVHVGRRRRIEVTVQFEGDLYHHRFAPAQRVKHVLRQALKHFEIAPADAKEYALQLCGTDDRPELDTHLGSLVCGPKVALCFDLVLKRRVQGWSRR